MPHKIVILDDRYDSYQFEKDVLEPMGATVVNVRAQAQDEVIAAVRDACGICVNLTPMPAPVIEALERCRVIARYGVGYDNVDVEAATAKGIWVANVTGYCDEDVSDQAFALFMSCVRKTAQRDRQVRAGINDLKATSPQYRIRGRTFVLFGYGRIARVLHRKLSGFELGRVLVVDPFVDADTIRAAGAEKVDFDTAIREGDYFSIHMPLNDETRHLFNETVFRAMKPTAMIINTSRGPVIDESALHRALSEGWIDSAGLDVFEAEPVTRDNPLLQLENLTASGHTGFYTEESLKELKTKAAENVKAVLTDGKPNYPVNAL